jgi:hypothetical protein
LKRRRKWRCLMQSTFFHEQWRYVFFVE